MLYTQLISFNESEEYNVRATSDLKEAMDLIAHGYQHVTDINGMGIYRKRK
jgi:hypothetical protein